MKPVELSDDMDFWSDEVILDPYPHYDRLRARGPVVWLSRHHAWAMTHYTSVRDALLAGDVFSSASGCMMNDAMNGATAKQTMLCSDDPDHLTMRRLFARPLMPKMLADLKPRFQALAETKIDELVARGTFDAVKDLAHFLPLAVVVELIGLDAEGRDRMLDWGLGIFDSFGPDGYPRTVSGIEIAQEAIGYVLQRVDRTNMIPGGWGEALFLAADRGEITEQTARMMLIDYLAPSLDTTINTTSAAIELFAANPGEWAKVVADPSLIPHAINEVIRLESPIRAFSRYTTRAYRLAGVEIETDTRALMLYACGNRDPLKYDEPARFDVTRRPSDHLGFGFGAHVCPGSHLSKLEISLLLEALTKKVKAFDVGTPERHPHNTLRGLASLHTTLRLH